MSEEVPRRKRRWLGIVIWILAILVATFVLIVLFEQNMPANL